MKFSVIALFVSVVAAAPALEKRTPPNIPTAASAKTKLASLTIRTTDATGYNRDLFPHWITQSGTCKYAEHNLNWIIKWILISDVSTREVVLKRDGTNVVQAADCSATSGTWFSPYDGATWTAASDLVCFLISPYCFTYQKLS